MWMGNGIGSSLWAAANAHEMTTCTQSIENCLKSIDMKKDDDAEENYESDEGDYL